MTEKRFTLTKGFDEHERQIRDNGKIIMGCFHEVQAKPIVDLLNALHEENKELKGENQFLKQVNEHFKDWFIDNDIREVIVGDCKVILND